MTSRRGHTSSDRSDSQQQARFRAPTQNCPSSLTSPRLRLQVKIFEEDFQRERSDRERMNEEKEELKKKVEKLQAQVTMSNAQVRAAGPAKRQLACPHGMGHGLEGPW